MFYCWKVTVNKRYEAKCVFSKVFPVANKLMFIRKCRKLLKACEV